MAQERPDCGKMFRSSLPCGFLKAFAESAAACTSDGWPPMQAGFSERGGGYP
jgi:hypothetical protein